MRRFLVLLVPAVAVLAAPAALAKEGVEASLLTEVPLEASPGSTILVRWTLSYRDDDGERHPFGASGVFVRLLSRSSLERVEGFAPDSSHPTGRYEATVEVPQGGIRDVEIGLQGWSSPGGRADMIFPITNDPLPGEPPLPDLAAAGAGEGAGLRVVLPATALAATVALAALAAALLARRRRITLP